jgi:tetratricopeptide (TPR) repeat protein
MANELVIADTYYSRTTAMGYGYRDFVANLAKSQTGELTGAMRENSNREIAATVASASMVAESVQRMQAGITAAIGNQTEAIQAGFGRVADELGRMSSEMHLGFARTEAAVARLSSDICGRLDKIANILENPRGTAARELYNNAFVNYRKGFYEEALPDVQKAVEMLTTDYLSWFLEGEIYAFGAGEFSNIIDLDKSIAAYTNAAKYISPDAQKSEDAKRLAAEIHFYLGLAQSAKSNELFRAGNQADSGALLSTARDSFMRSYRYSDLMLEARYNAARCKALLGDAAGALADLEAIINEDALYCVKTEAESDFDAIRRDYHRLIEKMRDELYEEAAPAYKEIIEGYKLAKQENLPQYFEKTVQITQYYVPANFNRRRLTSSGVAAATIPLFEQCLSEGFDKSLPYLDMRKRSAPYPVLLNILRKGVEAVFQTKANDDGGVTIVKYAGEDTQVVIPASIGGKPVTAIGERAFEQKQLTSVGIPESVKTIGDSAFSGNQLKSVTIGNSVKTIGNRAFAGNYLTSVVIPDSVVTIGNHVFGDNPLENVTIGANVNIGEWHYPAFGSFYNKRGKKAGEYVQKEAKNLSDKVWYTAEKGRKHDRWLARGKIWKTLACVLGSLFGLGIIIGGFVVGHWFIGIIAGIVTFFVVTLAFFARGWGILILALIGGGIALGIHVGHPFILGIIGLIAGYTVWVVASTKSGLDI